MPQAPRAMRASPRTTIERTNWSRRSSRHCWYGHVRRAPRARATRRSKSRKAPCSEPRRFAPSAATRRCAPPCGGRCGRRSGSRSACSRARIRAAGPRRRIPSAPLRSRKRRGAGRSRIFGAGPRPTPPRSRKRTSGAASCSSNWPAFASSWKRCPRRFPRTMRDCNILRTEAARLRREIDLSGGQPVSSRLRAEDLRPALRARIDAIPPDTAVVEYWLGKDEAFAWLLTRGRVQLVDLGPAGRIDAAARRMHDAMHAWLTGTVEERIARATRAARADHRAVARGLGARAHRVFHPRRRAARGAFRGAGAWRPRATAFLHRVARRGGGARVPRDSARCRAARGAQELGRAGRRRSGLHARRRAVRARRRSPLPAPPGRGGRRCAAPAHGRACPPPRARPRRSPSYSIGTPSRCSRDSTRAATPCSDAISPDTTSCISRRMRSPIRRRRNFRRWCSARSMRRASRASAKCSRAISPTSAWARHWWY